MTTCPHCKHPIPCGDVTCASGTPAEQDWEARALQEITEAVTDPDLAKLLVKKSGYPETLIPSFTTPIKFWSEVFGHADAGALLGGTRPLIDAVKKLYPGNPAFGLRGAGGTSSPFPEPIDDFMQLPAHFDGLFLGRRRIMDRLTCAWISDVCKIMSLIGAGGNGKTALVSKWIQEQTQPGILQAHYFAYSFYGQGADNATETSIDDFADQALAWLGIPIKTKGLDAKLRAIGNRLATYRCLLVLDGVETLLHPGASPPVHNREYRFSDLAMTRFLRQLCTRNAGLCIVTARFGLASLNLYKDGKSSRGPYWSERIESLHLETGCELLTHLGVHGPKGQLERAVVTCKGHALTLRLLGNYLRDAYNGDITKWSSVFNEHLDGTDAHANHVMASYVQHFGRGPQNQSLDLLALFYGAVSHDDIDALRECHIPGLTDEIQRMSSAEWSTTVNQLEKIGLLTHDRHRGKIDCHPVVRAFYRRRIRRNGPAWTEANQFLYQHFLDKAPDFPDNVSDMSTLLSAVPHGCEAGLFDEVLKTMFWRGGRGYEYYIIRILGMHSSALAAMSHFFHGSWTRLKEGLSPWAEATAYYFAAFDLMLTGRLKESAPLFDEAIKAYRRLAESGDSSFLVAAAVAAADLSEVKLTLGDLGPALDVAQQSVALAEKAIESDTKGCRKQMVISLTSLGTAYHCLGNDELASEQFSRATRLHRRLNPDYPLLSSLQGYRWLDFQLLHEGPEAVLQNIDRLDALDHARDAPSLSLLARALKELARARALRRLDPATALPNLEIAMRLLHDAKRTPYLALGHMARAGALRRINTEETLARAQEDLMSALDIAIHGKMRLRECDARLSLTRVYVARASLPDVRPEARAFFIVEGRREFRRAKELAETIAFLRKEQELDVASRSLEEAVRNFGDLARPTVFCLEVHAEALRTSAMDGIPGRLSEQGCRVVRVTLDRGVEQCPTLSTMLRTVREHARRITGPYTIVGAGVGGYVAALHAARDGENIGAMTLISPTLGLGRLWLEKLGLEGNTRWRESGTAQSIYGNRTHEVPYAFIEDALKHPECPVCDGTPCLVIQSKHDEKAISKAVREYSAESPDVRVENLPYEHGSADQLSAVVELIVSFQYRFCT